MKLDPWLATKRESSGICERNIRIACTSICLFLTVQENKENALIIFTSRNCKTEEGSFFRSVYTAYDQGYLTFTPATRVDFLCINIKQENLMRWENDPIYRAYPNQLNRLKRVEEFHGLNRQL